MAKQHLYLPCSDRDIRAAALKAAHEQVKALDEKGEPTVLKFGEILARERAKFQAFGKFMAKQPNCPKMTWEEYKEASDKFAEKQ